jgi:hypothetical protein
MSDESTGLKEVMQNLNTEILAIVGRSMKGLIESAHLVREDMGRTPPLIPFDTGNLEASWFTSAFFNGKDPVVKMGFSANYAAWVHEMVGADFSSTRVRYGPGKGRRREYTPRAGAGAKFLEAAVNRNVNNILEAIRKEAEIK